MDVKPRGGLEDVVAATSAICYLDGDRGVLAYYGHDIHDLARSTRTYGLRAYHLVTPVTTQREKAEHARSRLLRLLGAFRHIA